MAAEVCLAAFSSIVSEGTKTLLESIRRQTSYVFKYQSYIDKLKNQVKELGYIRERVEISVDRATLQGDEIFKDSVDWLHSVKEFIESIVDDDDGAKKSCFKGLCPNLFSCYKLGKQAAKAAEDAVNLVVKGNLIKSNVSYRPAPKSTEHMQVKDYQAFDSRIKVFQDVVEALKNDKLNIIGVYGMGGVGKTTLVKQVAKQVREDKLFDKVVMAEVTQKPDPQEIQEKLAFDLGMEFGLNENKFQRADRLRERLKKEKKVLVILDNIWTKLELDAVGIPSGEVKNERKDELEIPSGDVQKARKDDQRRCTIILTSRNRDLLEKDMKSQKNFPIKVLLMNEALQLFENIVGDSEKTSAIQPIADEIVERCEGLPVALSTIANALKSKKLDFWKDALNQLRSSNAREIHGMSANVYTSIELSYNFLESEEAKSLFLLCGLYSEGDAIQVPSLLRYAKGWGLFKNVYTLEEARSRVHTLIDILKASCLLLDADAEDEAKMHDVIQVVAASIAKEKRMFNIPNVADLEKKMEETIQEGPIAISLPYRAIQELPARLECPQLKLFLLFAKNGSSLQISDLFFEGTEELRVLDFTGIRFSSLPSSLGRLINVQTLCLDWCQLDDIAVIGQLKKLEILSFQGSDIERLPLEIGQLMRLRLLDLSNCMRLQVIAPNVISKLSRLEELYMGNSFSQWDMVEGGSNASLVELKGLSKLTTLELHVPNAQILPQDLISVELQRYKICIGEEWGSSWTVITDIVMEWVRWDVKSETSRSMKLQRLEKLGILLENYGMKMLLKRTEDLYLDKLMGVQNVVHELDDGEGFPRLKHLHVKYCCEILYIVGSVGPVRCKVFPLLESLSLIRLINLETICDSQLTEDQSFSNLRIIKVKFCDKLKHLFSLSMAKNLLRLQKVQVADCDKLKMIVGPDMEKLATTLGSKEIIAEDEPVHKVVFPSLEKLKLENLSNIEKLWPDQFQGMSYCHNLTKVTVENCHRLKFLFSYSMVKRLVQLQRLDIWGCESMEGVVDITELGRDEGNLIELTVFPKLHSMWLSWLPKLTSFANTGYIHLDSVVEFPSLLMLKINRCDNMLRFISKTSPEDNVHTEMQPQPLFDKKVRFPSLEVLHIWSMRKLRKIWHHQLDKECFSKLKKLHIERCSNLMNIFPALVGIPSSLVNLNVSHSEQIEEIIGHVGEEMKDNRIAFSELKLLELDHLPRLTSFCLEKYNLEFPSLERVSVIACPTMKTFSHGVLSTPKLCEVEVTRKEGNELRHWEGNLNSTIQKCYEEMVGFRNIEYLTLSHFPRLREIWHGQGGLSVNFFNNLRRLVVDDCTNMSNAIPANLLRCLNNLGMLDVTNCDSLEEVLHLQERINAGEEYFGQLFPKLTSLNLIDLPKLKRFCNFTEIIIELPMLRNLTIKKCPNIESFISNSTYVLHMTTDNREPEEITLEENFLLADHIQPLFDEKVRLPSLEELKISFMDNLRKIWHSQLASESFNKLKNLEIIGCHNLMNIFPLLVGISSSLVNLKVSYCEKIEEIIGHAGEEVKENRIAFSELKLLELDDLPRLTSFCLENYTLEFPSLERASVIRCPNMKTFSQGVLSTPKLYKVQVTKKEEDELRLCEMQATEKEEDELHYWEGNLNSTIQKCYEEMVGFCDIEFLTLSRFPRLREIWHGQALPVSFFNNLVDLAVDDCMNMSSAIPANLLRCLNKLEYLEVSNCDSLEEVFHLEEPINADEEHFGQLFPKLTSLGLSDLPKLKRFCNFTENIIELPKLRNLIIENCPEMETFITNSASTERKEPQEITSVENFLLADHIQPLFDEKVRLPSLEKLKISFMDNLRKIWHNQLASESFNKLKNLEIKWCHNLINIFPLLDGIPSSLVNLNVSGCKNIKEIIGQVGEEVKENRIAFRELKLLELDNLRRITSFCLENYTLEFPSLERVSVTRCPSMKTFSLGVVSTPKLYEVQVTKGHPYEDGLRGWEGNLNSTIQKCYEEMVGFGDIEYLTLSHFPRLRELWHGQALPVSFFNNLRGLVVDDCTNMSSALPANLLRCLNKLEHLEVRNCDSLEEVFHSEEPINAYEEHFGQLFPKLTSLNLSNLPKLKRFCKFTENKIELPMLRNLTIEKCPNLEISISKSTFVLHKIANNKEPQEITWTFN